MIETIERLTGRMVAAFMSTSHQSPDLVGETFVFEPEGKDTENPLEAVAQSVSAG